LTPGLLPALASLTESQRVAVVLIHGYGWSQTETARLLDISHATVRTHLARALAHLQKALEVRENAD
jgi:RNA polymerase sigma factor (sigma-70 family)